MTRYKKNKRENTCTLSILLKHLLTTSSKRDHCWIIELERSFVEFDNINAKVVEIYGCANEGIFVSFEVDNKNSI